MYQINDILNRVKPERNGEISYKKFLGKFINTGLGGALIPKQIYCKFLILNLNVRNGHRLIDWLLGSCLTSRVKVDNKKYNQNFILLLNLARTTISTTKFWKQNYNKIFFHLKPLDFFQDNFKHIPNRNQCHVFGTNLIFSVLYVTIIYLCTGAVREYRISSEQESRIKNIVRIFAFTEEFSCKPPTLFMIIITLLGNLRYYSWS